MLKESGGPAFPTTQYANGVSPSGHDGGMTMRDYFAAKAMQGFATTLSGMATINYELLAADAYQMADAMLKERSK